MRPIPFFPKLLFPIVLSLLLGSGPGSLRAADEPASRILFEHAIVTKEDVAEAVKFETALQPNYDVLAPAGQPWFQVLDGTSRVLITAPHATAQTREGARKGADGGTGALAYMLNKLAHTPVIETTYMSPSVPNYYDDNDFKKKVTELVAQHHPVIVLDLHASDSFRPYDVDFGTMHGKSFLGRPDLFRKLADQLQKAGLTDLSQDYFGAEAHQTDTKWISGHGTPCIQLEFSETRLALTKDDLEAHRFAQTLEGLIRFIRYVDALPEKSVKHKTGKAAR